MNCIVTAGPTYEPLDEVRRLTNFSTGTIGSHLANFLTERGHKVELLLGHYSTYRGEQKARRVRVFTTTSDLREQLKARGSSKIHAVFHAAAVSDFGFGKIYTRTADGKLKPVKAAKLSTRGPALLAELKPTPKILKELRGWFPEACIVGWKYELEGDVIKRALEQIRECRTNACVVNGKAYGSGCGLVLPDESLTHYPRRPQLFAALEKLF